MNKALVWLRQDLRLIDNPALTAALQQCQQVILLYIDDYTENPHPEGAASRVWLHHSLQALQQRIQSLGNRLIIRQGQPLAILNELIQAHDITHLFWNRCYTPYAIQRDKHIKTELKPKLTLHSFNASLLFEPWQVSKPDGHYYRVFTPFWKRCLQLGLDSYITPEPDKLPAPAQWPESLNIEQLKLLPHQAWGQHILKHWQVGEAAAQQALQDFLIIAEHYRTERDYPARLGTSRLSAHLHFGEISPRQILYHSQHALHQHPNQHSGIDTFLKEVGWREFAWHMLFHVPNTIEAPLNTRFQAYPWRDPDEYQHDLKRWQQGKTGFPIVDAGMRELWQTGWMHNRVRMIVASFLTKNLRIPWQEGERWFRDTLVDADLASNVFGWQWTAGCGADAAPYFRIFNPITQGQKFDKQGEYIRRWIPELAQLSPTVIHEPLNNSALKQYNYPAAITDLKASRAEALAGYEAIKTSV